MSFTNWFKWDHQTSNHMLKRKGDHWTINLYKIVQIRCWLWLTTNWIQKYILNSLVNWKHWAWYKKLSQLLEVIGTHFSSFKRISHVQSNKEEYEKCNDNYLSQMLCTYTFQTLPVMSKSVSTKKGNLSYWFHHK